MIPAAPCRALWVVIAAGVATGCPSTPEPVTPVNPQPPPIVGEPVQGAYVWYGRSRNGDRVRAELEVWQLAERGETILGTMRRRVWVIAEGGPPFRCNQGHWFESNAEYQIEGKRAGLDIVLRETAVTVEPSPCDREPRPLASYQGRHAAGALHLRSTVGTQIVRRHRSAPRLPSPRLEAPPTTGRYEWVTESRDDGVVRTEREEWELVETDGVVDGSYVRTVRERRERGVFSCNGTAERMWTDRYTLTGARDGNGIRVRELIARPAPSDRCLPYAERSLDAARGHIYPREIVLRWRNNRRQVLRRAATAPLVTDP